MPVSSNVRRQNPPLVIRHAQEHHRPHQADRRMKRVHSSWFFLGSIYGGVVIAALNPVAGVVTAASLYHLYKSRKAVENSERELKQQAAKSEFKRRFQARQNFDSYEDYLVSDVWRAKRALVVTRAMGCCEHSGCTRAVDEVHHIRYPRTWGNEPTHWLVGLCEEHHREAHGNSSGINKR